MTRAHRFLAGLALVAGCGLIAAGAAHAGEDPVLGVVTATGMNVNAGCVSTAAIDTPGHLPPKLAFQCSNCKIRYRLLTTAEHTTGHIVPTDGGPMWDGGVWGPLVDFTVNGDPYKATVRPLQTKICFMTEDAGAAFVARTEVFGAY